VRSNLGIFGAKSEKKGYLDIKKSIYNKFEPDFAIHPIARAEIFHFDV